MNSISLITLVLIAAASLSHARGGPGAVKHTDINYNLDDEIPRAPYLDSPEDPASNSLDIFEPGESGKQRPIVLYVHGGGWMQGDKSATHSKDELFTRNGYLFISVNYRLSPFPVDKTYPPDRVRSPHHVEDVAEAVAWLQIHAKEFGGNPKSITLMGHSAGAQLVCLLATDPQYLRARGVAPSVIKGVVALDSAAYDVALSIQNATLPAMRYQAFGTTLENQATDSWLALSATAHGDPSDAPILLITQASEPTRIAQCEQLAIALGQNPASSVLAVNKSHGEINQHLGSAADTSSMTPSVIAFVGRVMP